MDVLDLLPHDIIAFDNLRVTSFLPHLVFLVRLVPQLVILQLLQQRFVLPLFHDFDNGSRRERLELADTFGQLRAGGDPMQMVFHDHKGQDRNVPLALQKPPTFENDFRECRLRKDGKPSHHGVGHEVRITVFAETVAGSSHGATLGSRLVEVLGI